MLFLAERRRNAELVELLKASAERAAAERQRAEQRMAERHLAMMQQHRAMMALIAKLSDAIDCIGYGNRKPPP